MTEHEHHIEDHKDGTYTLYVDQTPVAKIDWWNKTNVRVCRWMVHGPADLSMSIAMMRGFLHLTALLGNEKQGIVRPLHLKSLSLKNRRMKMANIKNDPAVQALLAKAAEKAAKDQAKAVAAVLKQLAQTSKLLSQKLLKLQKLQKTKQVLRLCPQRKRKSWPQSRQQKLSKLQTTPVVGLSHFRSPPFFFLGDSYACI